MHGRANKLFILAMSRRRGLKARKLREIRKQQEIDDARLSATPTHQNHDDSTPTICFLPNLPVEILSMVGEYLPSLDIVCLSLSSRRLFQIFQRDYQELLEGKDRRNPYRYHRYTDRRLELLERRSWALPRYYPCMLSGRLCL